MDAYWAKDILELFRLERRHSFLRFVELLMGASGGLFEATRFARHGEVSRTTIANYLAVLEATFVVHVLRPFSRYRATEIVSAPKVYGFDTGFVCYYRGWHELRGEDMGLMWEHFVLNELQAHLQSRAIRYWRDKKGHEVDFIIARRGSPVLAIECKWSAADLDVEGLVAFLRRYPSARGYVAIDDIERPFVRRFEDLPVTLTNLPGLVEAVVS